MFVSHGEFVISSDENILKVIAKGPFNTEAVDIYEADLLNSIKKMSGPWGQLNFMHDNCLYTPQAKQKMYDLTKLRKDHNLAAVAFIFNQCVADITLKEQLADIYLQWDIPCEFFDSDEKALLWLKASIIG